MGLAVAKGRAEEPQRMPQASSHTRLQFQAQAVSFSFRRNVPCVLQCDHSDLWELCECDANKRCRARHSNRTSVLNLRNLRAFPALRGETRRRNPTSEPRMLGWELCVPSWCARAVGAGAGSSAQAQQGQGTAAPCPQGWPGLHCTRCSHRASPAPAQPQGTQCGTEGLPAWALPLGQAGQQGPRHTWAPLAPFPLPGAAGQAPGTCWALLPGLDTCLKDNTSPEVLPVHPELGEIHEWDRKICFPLFLFMAQEKKKVARFRLATSPEIQQQVAKEVSICCLEENKVWILLFTSAWKVPFLI